MKILGFQQGSKTTEIRPATTASTLTTQPITTMVTAAVTGTTTDLPRHPSMPIGTSSRTRRPGSSPPATNPAIPCVTPEFFNAIIKASKDWRVYDILRIVQHLNMGHHHVTHNNTLQTITKLLETIPQYGFATMVQVVWHGGPNCRTKMRSNLAHWLLDNLMWEVRLGSRNTKDGSSGHALKAKILSIL